MMPLNALKNHFGASGELLYRLRGALMTEKVALPNKKVRERLIR